MKKAEKKQNLVDCIYKYIYRGMKAGEEGTGTKCSLILQVKDFLKDEMNTKSFSYCQTCAGES